MLGTSSCLKPAMFYPRNLKCVRMFTVSRLIIMLLWVTVHLPQAWKPQNFRYNNKPNSCLYLSWEADYHRFGICSNTAIMWWRLFVVLQLLLWYLWWRRLSQGFIHFNIGSREYLHLIMNRFLSHPEEGFAVIWCPCFGFCRLKSLRNKQFTSKKRIQDTKSRGFHPVHYSYLGSNFGSK